MRGQVVLGREDLAASGAMGAGFGRGVVRRRGRGRGGKRSVFDGRRTKLRMTNRLRENRHRFSAVVLMMLWLLLLLLLMSGERVGRILGG